MTTKSYRFNWDEKVIVGILAFLQFTIILDFMILSPLGAILMESMKISTSQFGLVVSGYAFAAGAGGLFTAGFADRFDRKKLLLFFYCGFLIGTLLCGLVDSYNFLLAARILTGLFGGVIGSIVFSITTDLFPYHARGQVMGIIQTAFAASQILGIPAGLYLSANGNWHLPFLAIVSCGVVVGVVIYFKMAPMVGHLASGRRDSPWHHLQVTFSSRRNLQAFATVALLSTGGYMLMPFGSAFAVNNLGISLKNLPFVYMVSGFAAIFTGPLIGKSADRYGKFRLFVLGSTLSMIMVLVYTNLGPTTWPWLTLVNVILFIGISGRVIPAQALISAVPAKENRGSFMAVSSSLQQISGGFAAALAGALVEKQADGHLDHFSRIGYFVVGASLITMAMMSQIRKEIPQETEGASGP